MDDSDSAYHKMGVGVTEFLSALNRRAISLQKQGCLVRLFVDV